MGSPRPTTAVLGPDAGLATWPYYGAVSFEPIPSTVINARDLDAFMAEEEAEHLVVTPGTVDARRGVFEGVARVDAVAVQIASLPSGWQFVYVDPPERPSVVVIQVDSTAGVTR